MLDTTPMTAGQDGPILRLSAAPEARLADGRLLTLAPSDAALLAWLALEGPTSRNRLAELLWPRTAPEAARNTLRQRLFKLRRQFGGDLVDGQSTLALAPAVRHDLHDSDDVLRDAAIEIEGEYREWLMAQRRRRQSRVLQSLVELADLAEKAQDWNDALSHAEEALAMDAVSEDAHRRVIRLHYLRGDRAAALLAFDRCERVLKAEVGTRPGERTLALLATIESSGPTSSAPALGPVPASVLRPPRLIGRDAEIQALQAGWQASQVVALIGEAGIGKTRLLQSFIEHHPGVVRAAGRPGDAGVPFATLARLLRAVIALEDDTSAPALAPQTRTEIARVLPEFDAGGRQQANEGQRLVLQRAVRALLTRQPRLTGLAVDDLHFADEASLEMLGSLIEPDEPLGFAGAGAGQGQGVGLGFGVDAGAGEGAGAGRPSSSLRWILAYRSAEAGTPVQALHDVLVEQARLAPVTLAALDEAALAALVDSLGLPGVNGRALAPGLAKRTGGNPLFVLETLKQAWVDRTLAQIADTGLMPRPPSVARLIERRVALLSPQALMLARVASVAGVDFSIALAEQALGVPAMQFADALNELESAQVMRGNAFVHDLVFEAVHASVPATIAAHTHAKVAAWLEQRQSEPARIAAHWIAAGEAPRALPWLQQAAEAARRALRPKEFIAFMERKSAIEEAAGERDAAFESLALATAVLIDLDPEAGPVQAQCDRMDALAFTPHQRVDALVQRAVMHKQRGEFQALAEVSDRAMMQSTALGDAERIADCHNLLGNAYCLMQQDAKALSHLEAALAWAESHGNDRDRANAHGSLAVIYDNLARLDEALPHHELGFTLSCANGEFGDAAQSCGNIACNRIDAGDLMAAEQSLQRGQRIVAQYDSFSATSGLLQMLRTLCLCHLGQYTDALQQAELGLASVRQHQPGYENHALLRLATCWWHLGQWSRMAPLLADPRMDQGMPMSARTQQALLQWRYARATDASGTAVERARQRMEALLPEVGDEQRPDLRLPLHVELASALAPQQALQELERVCAEAERIRYQGIVLAARIRAAAAGAVCDPPRGRREALAALALAQTHGTTVLLPAELWLHAGRALVAAGDAAHGAEVWAQGRDWLLDKARHQVQEPFRESFLQRVAVNRELMATASSSA